MIDELGAAFLAIGYLWELFRKSRWGPRLLVLMCLGINWFLALRAESLSVLFVSFWVIVQVLFVCLAI